MLVRALLRVAKVKTASPPYDSIYVRLFYPAYSPRTETERDTGICPPIRDNTPFPVIIFFPGINVGPEMYQWLAEGLCKRGFAVVTFSWVFENLPGLVSLTPGIDIAMVRPERYGTGPTASALPALLETLQDVQANSVLAGLLDLNKVILGGHSAGGTVVLQNTNPAYFPQVAGGFTYGAHTAAATMLGYAAGTILPVCGDLPLLLMGGTQDGVVAASSGRYGSSDNTATAAYSPIERTFKEAFYGGRGDSYYVLIEGANHFVITHPLDSSTGRPFLDLPVTQPEDHLRALLLDLISHFIETHILKTTNAMQQYQSGRGLLAQVECK